MTRAPILAPVTTPDSYLSAASVYKSVVNPKGYSVSQNYNPCQQIQELRDAKSPCLSQEHRKSAKKAEYCVETPETTRPGQVEGPKIGNRG